MDTPLVRYQPPSLREVAFAKRMLEGVRESFARHGVEMTYDHLNVHIVEK